VPGLHSRWSERRTLVLVGGFKINILDGKCFPLGGVSISALDKIDLMSIKNMHKVLFWQTTGLSFTEGLKLWTVFGRELVFFEVLINQK